MSKRFTRTSGVVMPIFSLQSNYGIGTFGKSAYDFVDFLVKAGQKYWQVLPMGHTEGSSPYHCFSTVAGNPLFIDLDKLVEMGLLERSYLQEFALEYSTKVDYDKVNREHFRALKEAYDNMSSEVKKEVKYFEKANKDWISDYALFMAVRNYFGKKAIWEWNDSHIRRHEPKAVNQYTNLLKVDIEFYIFVQYLFFKQWNELKEYANKKGILFIGDIPMYPSPNSSDIWSNSKLFKVDEKIRPSGIAGVPPDYYSSTGQLWGNPVYDWNVHEKDNYSWWIWRIRHTLDMADVIRIDHFRAFQDYWEVPSGEKTAINGKWYPGPRMKLFKAIKENLGDIPIIAEDLGDIDESVRELLKETGYPGMGVMIFALRANEDNLHMPHNWKQNSIGYTATHDSETFCQAVSELNEEDKEFALEYVNANDSESLGFSAIRTAFASSSNIVMVMAADILSLDSEGRINVPGTVGEHNWSWRAPVGAFDEEIANKLRKLTCIYKRIEGNS